MRNNLPKKAYLRACGTLQDFLSKEQQSRELLQLSFELNPSAKDLLEAQGIPHTAVFQLFINGQLNPLNQNIRDGDVLVAYPFSATSQEKIDSVFYSPKSFLADVHLGKLSKTLRLLGIDVQPAIDLSKQEIIQLSNSNKKMILTRNIQLLKNSKTLFGYWVRSTDPDTQVGEIFQRFKIISKVAPFSRCMECNGILQEVPLQKVRGKVPPKVQEWHDAFYKCTTCSRVYWQGSHYQKLKQKVSMLIRKYS